MLRAIGRGLVQILPLSEAVQSLPAGSFQNTRIGAVPVADRHERRGAQRPQAKGGWGGGWGPGG